MSADKKDAVAVSAPAKDPKKQQQSKKDDQKLSDEDQRIKEEVELLVTRSCDKKDDGLAAAAIKHLSDMLQTATGTVASIPKPLKYVRQHYQQLKERALEMGVAHPNSKILHDVMALIAMTMEIPDAPCEALDMKLLGTTDDLAQWGYQFVRHLAGNVAKTWNDRVDKANSSDEPLKLDDLTVFVHQIVDFMMKSQDEAAAIDLAIEIGQLGEISKYANDENYDRVAQYLTAIAKYMPPPEDLAVLEVVFGIYVAKNAFTSALRIAFLLQSTDKAKELFDKCGDETAKKQMALMCGRARFQLSVDEGGELDELIGNCKLSDLFRTCATDLDSNAPKNPEEIYKEHLMEKRHVPQTANSHMHNLASTFVNAFANAGYGKDTLMSEQKTNWIFQTKEHRMMSTTASLGLIYLWDHDCGPNELSTYSYNEDNNIKAGSLLGTGILMCGVKTAFDEASELQNHVSNPSREIRVAAITGLGIAYSGTSNNDVKELLIPIVADAGQPLEMQCLAALSLAQIFVATSDSDACEVVSMCLTSKTEAECAQPVVRYLVLALGLLFLRKADQADMVIEAVNAMAPPNIQRYAEVVITSCAYAATGNVIAVQKLYSIVAERETDEEKKKKEEEEKKRAAADAGAGDSAAAANATGDANGADAPPADAAAAADATASKPSDAPSAFNYKAAAVLGIGLIAIAEPLGSDMTKRSLLHALLAKDDAATGGRRAVPLALAMLSVSDPNMQVVENLSKLSHDTDAGTAMSAILGIGLVAAGTNNARVSQLLRNLSGYYSKEKDRDLLFVVRLAQGLTALGKGHITLSPFVSDGLVLNDVALAGLMGVCHSALDFQGTILDKYHFMVYSSVLSMSPRMLTTVNSDLEPVQTHVRVGTAVDTVAMAGKQKTITGFQTHQTPVLLQEKERAELVPGKWKAEAPVLDGVVILTEKAASGDNDDDAGPKK